MREATLDLPQMLLPRIGGMATMPSRVDSLRKALPHILPQVDKLFLYLDQYDEVPPELAAIPKVVTLLPRKGTRLLGSAGKFRGLKMLREPCLYFCFDDDIVYHRGYVDHLAAALLRHGHRCIVGLHGTVYARSVSSYVKDRHVVHFSMALFYDVVVDELGTGTIAFHSRVIDIDPSRWEHPNHTDLQTMLDAVRQKVPRICVHRPAGLIRPIEEKQPDSLYVASLADDSRETMILQTAMAHYPGLWCMSS